MTSSQPRVRRNEWGSLLVPQVGAWQPHLEVSIVMPAYGAHRTLPFVMAGLAAQTYPSHLVEVIVVDDGAHVGLEPLQLPEVRPDNVRIVQVEESWGRANACHLGAGLAEGEVIHWLDADMLPAREHLEAQLRWHHEVDYAVVLGHKWFVDPAPLDGVDPADVRTAVADDSVSRYFPPEVLEPHEWVERYYAHYDDLRTIGPRACRMHVGATASLMRDLYLDSGGIDTTLKLGEDIAFGYRLGEAGAVFVPEREARSWHLGLSHAMVRRQEVNDYNDCFMADRLPELRNKRRAGRLYSVPYLEVVLDTTGLPHASVVATVDAVLSGTLSDLVVTLVGPWGDLDDGRTHPLDDPLLDTRLVWASYAGDPRVRLVESLPEGRCPAMFRMWLHTADWAPTHKTVARLVHHLERTHHGLLTVRMPDGHQVRIERTAAMSRAQRVMKSGEFLDDVLDELFGAWTFDAAEVGFWPSHEVHRARLQGTAGIAEDPAVAWDHVDVPIAPGRAAAELAGHVVSRADEAGHAHESFHGDQPPRMAVAPAPDDDHRPSLVGGLARTWRRRVSSLVGRR